MYLAAEQAGAMVSIAVIDRGIGIFPEDLHRVVKKFARGQNAPGSVPVWGSPLHPALPTIMAAR